MNPASHSSASSPFDHRWRRRRPPQHADDQPSLAHGHVLLAAVPGPRALDAIAVALPEALDCKPDVAERGPVEEVAHLLAPRVEPCDDPGSRRGGLLEEPRDGPVQVGVLPRHPQAVAHEDAVEPAPVLYREGRVQLSPRVPVDREGCELERGRVIWLGVERDVPAQSFQDGFRGVVRHDYALGPEKSGHDARQRSAGAQLQALEAGDVEVVRFKLAQTDAQGQVQGAGLEELGEHQARIPEVMTEELAIALLVRVRERYVQGLR